MAALCTVWLLFPGLGSGAAAAPQLRGPGLPVIAVIGCRLVNGALVCGRDGTLLPNRLRRPKARAKQPTKTYKPAQRKTPSTKSQSSKGGTSRSAPSSTGQDVEDVEDVEDDEAEDTPAAPESETEDDDAGKDNATPSCPTGTVVLEKPNASGSFCEPVDAKPATETAPAVEAPAEAAEQPQSEPTATAEEPVDEAPPGSTDMPTDIREAACGPEAGPGACNCPGGSAYDSDACKTAIPSCCSAKVSADGKPQPAISRCGADQNKAMSEVVSSAMEKKLTLGPVRCTNQ